MNALINFWQANGTKILGGAAGTIATLCGANVIPDYQMKYWLAAIAVLTYWRGNGNTQAIAQAVVDKHLDSIATLQAAQAVPLVISSLEKPK